MLKHKGFTLTELIVVMVIVGILASVSIPMMRANTRRAILTEAQSVLGLIRSAARAYYAEHGAYPPACDFSGGAGGFPGIVGEDLNGTYFSRESFAYQPDAATAGDFVIDCYWNTSGGGYTSNAPKKDELARVFPADCYLEMWDDGTWSDSGNY